MAQRIIFWFRNDLRLHDNEALCAAVKSAREIIPVYIFDPRQFEKTRLGFRRTGALRTQFSLESVTDLRNRLREKGGDLLIRIGEPEKIISQLAETFNATHVYTSKEIAPEETQIESSLSKKLKVANVDIKLFWMDTLGHATDLPFSIAKLPSNFNTFHTQIARHLKIQSPFPEPERVVLPHEYDAGIIPSLPMLGIDPQDIGKAGNSVPNAPKGGETAALINLKVYVRKYIVERQNWESRDHLVDSRLSDWLSLGCLSARYIYNSAKEALQNPQEQLTITDNLVSRDYFHWTLLKYGPRLFKPSGIKHNFHQSWLNDNALFAKWANAETGDPDMDGIMLKLNSTGHLTSFEREAAAYYLVNQSGVNWTWGAMYFESVLIDYDVSVNWGKWNNIAGVGE